jgi:hypothetical protein
MQEVEGFVLAEPSPYTNYQRGVVLPAGAPWVAEFGEILSASIRCLSLSRNPGHFNCPDQIQ